MGIWWIYVMIKIVSYDDGHIVAEVLLVSHCDMLHFIDGIILKMMVLMNFNGT